MKEDVISDPNLRPFPYNRHELTQDILPLENNLLQAYLDDLFNFTSKNQLIINEKKIRVMIFNVRRKIDLPP